MGPSRRWLDELRAEHAAKAESPAEENPKLAEYIRRTVDAAPPLTPAQIDKLRILLWDEG